MATSEIDCSASMLVYKWQSHDAVDARNGVAVERMVRGRLHHINDGANAPRKK